MAEYINRDEVLSMSYCTNKPTWDNPHLDPKSVVDVEDIESLPTADVVEVVHSEWKDDVFVKGYPSVKCPECNIRFCDIISNHRCMWYYCPNCGAKMDGKKNG